MIDLLENLMLEGIASARKTYLDTGKISNEDFDKLIAIDTTPKKKYMEWMANAVVNYFVNIETLEQVIPKFDSLANKGIIKDSSIYSYNPEELVAEVEKHEKTKTASQVKKEIKKDVVKVHEDDKYLIVHPKTPKASIYYGKGTKWCTSAVNDNMFEHYDLQGVKFYYIIDKNTDEKWAIAVYSHGQQNIYNNEDKTIKGGDLPKEIQDFYYGGMFVPFTADEAKARNLELFKTYIAKDGKLIENDDGTYDFIGDFAYNFLGSELTMLPIKFNKVTGNMYLSGVSLNSLENCPKEVTEDFKLSTIETLPSLVGSPETIGGSFELYLTTPLSLEGFPKYIGEDIYINSGIKSLKGLPENFEGSLFLSCEIADFVGCPSGTKAIQFKSSRKLKSLEGCPSKLSSLVINSVAIETLEGGPKEVGIFNVSYTLVKSLKGGPEKVNKFICKSIPLKSLEYFPTGVTYCDISDTQVESLEGITNEVEYLNISHCRELKSLQGLPEDFAGEIYWEGSPIHDFANFPKATFNPAIKGKETMKESTTACNISFLPGGGTDIKTILKGLSSQQEDWDIEILENDEDYSVKLDKYDISVSKSDWDDFSKNYLSNMKDKKINLKNFMESKTMNYRKVLLEATDITIYKRLLNVLGSYSSKNAGTGLDLIFDKACETGKKILPKDKKALEIIDNLIDVESPASSVHKLLNLRFANVDFDVRPITKNGRRKETAFWCVDGKVNDKVSSLINFDGVSKGFWCDMKGEKVELVDHVVEESVNEGSITAKIKNGINDIVDDYGDTDFDLKDIIKGLKGYLTAKEIKDNKGIIRKLAKKYV